MTDKKTMEELIKEFDRVTAIFIGILCAILLGLSFLIGWESARADIYRDCKLTEGFSLRGTAYDCRLVEDGGEK